MHYKFVVRPAFYLEPPADLGAVCGLAWLLLLLAARFDYACLVFMFSLLSAGSFHVLIFISAIFLFVLSLLLT